MNVTANRACTFRTQTGGGYTMQNTDTWWDATARAQRTVISQALDVGSAWFGCDTPEAAQQKGQVPTPTAPGIYATTITTLTDLSVGEVGPSLLMMTGTLQVATQEVIVHTNHTVELEDPDIRTPTSTIIVDMSRAKILPTNYVNLMYPPPATAPAAVTAQTPVTVTLPGDFRRPKWATTTRMLTDDELLSVASCAGRVGLSGPELLAILIELTGARQDAYYPDQFYGIAGLTTAQLTSAMQGVPATTAELTLNIAGQLNFASTVLSRPGVMGNPLAIYLTLATGATGQTWANAGPTSPLPSPLPPRLQPSSPDTPPLADIANRIAQRAALVNEEFTARLPLKLGLPQ